MHLVQGVLNSRSKVSLLGLLLERPDYFSVSELSRLAGIPKATVSLVVKEWETAGLVLTRVQGRNKLVGINQRFQLLPDLKAIFRKSKNYNFPFFSRIQRLPVLKRGQVLAVVAFGSRARDAFVHASDLDVLVVLKSKNSGLTEKIVDAFVALSGETGIRFSPTFLDRVEFAARLAEKDHFVKNVLAEGKILRGAKWLEHLQAVS